ncbi:TPA: L,D-transpeptidase family protein [Neisseria gonorrhoeae]
MICRKPIGHTPYFDMNKTICRTAALLISGFSYANTVIPDVSPVAQGQHVFINIPQQRLFLYTDGKLTKVYPVAVGRAMTQTNLGEHKIGAKAYNPVWHIPKSIQKERGDGVKTIAAGPDNPLGPVFVRLGDPKLGLGIHGTNAPTSVPGIRSHGCVRMKSPDALEFAKTIATGSPASVIYQMAGLNEDADRNLWLAAFRDPYGKNNLDTASLKKSIGQWAKTQGKTIAPEKVDAVLKDRTGSAVCLTCGKNGKMKMPLKSLAWIQGSSSYSQAEVIEQTEETNSAEVSETRTPEVPDVHTPEAQAHLNTQSDGTPTAYTEPAADSSPQVESPDQAASEPVDVLFSIDVIRQGNLRLGN